MPAKKSIVYGASGLSDSPWPGRSGAITRQRSANAAIVGSQHRVRRGEPVHQEQRGTVRPPRRRGAAMPSTTTSRASDRRAHGCARMAAV